jgi:hypothetical protein
MGHLLLAGRCYRERARPYSPLLWSRLGRDYAIPAYLLPMQTFQVGLGSGAGIGVPPEHHQASWFAQVRGRKRWLFYPPLQTPPLGALRRGQYSAERPDAGKCQLGRVADTALRCDVQLGDIIWTPGQWWHETCSLDGFSVGFGGLVEDEANQGRHPSTCAPPLYQVKDVAFCLDAAGAINNTRCPSIDDVHAAVLGGGEGEID